MAANVAAVAGLLAAEGGQWQLPKTSISKRSAASYIELTEFDERFQSAETTPS
jgi:hypothetical protein